MSQHAIMRKSCAPLSDPNVEAKAVEYGLQENLAALPLIIRGANKGRHKGYLHVVRCVMGGWSHDQRFPRAGMSGRVVKPGEVVAWVSLTQD